jgi:mono/diheme cytochrome c family protein
MKRLLIAMIVISILLLGCSSTTSTPTPTPHGPRMGMGRGGGMMERHHATIPEEYAGLTNPVPSDNDSLARGAEVYTAQCASCHGDGGMGDGPAGTALDPLPAAIAHTSQQMGDDYLFWRISEGGVPFSTAMPPWKTLDEQTRWDLVNYMRALGQGVVKPVNSMGGATFDPEIQAEHQAAMLAQAVEQGVITQEEAMIFETTHTALENYRTTHPDVAGDTTDEREAAMLAELVSSQVITQEQAGAFRDIHDRLGASGLMP